MFLYRSAVTASLRGCSSRYDPPTIEVSGLEMDNFDSVKVEKDG